MTDNKLGIWTDKFSSSSVEDLEDGLLAVLALQASRVQELIEQPLTDDATPEQQLRHSERIDKQLDKVFKNGLSLRNAKASNRTAVKKVDSERAGEIPERPTPQMLADGLAEMERRALLAGDGFDREAISEYEVWDFLTENGEVMPRPNELENAF